MERKCFNADKRCEDPWLVFKERQPDISDLRALISKPVKRIAKKALNLGIKWAYSRQQVSWHTDTQAGDVLRARVLLHTNGGMADGRLVIRVDANERIQEDGAVFDRS